MNSRAASAVLVGIVVVAVAVVPVVVASIVVDLIVVVIDVTVGPVAGAVFDENGPNHTAATGRHTPNKADDKRTKTPLALIVMAAAVRRDVKTWKGRFGCCFVGGIEVGDGAPTVGGEGGLVG